MCVRGKYIISVSVFVFWVKVLSFWTKAAHGTIKSALHTHFCPHSRRGRDNTSAARLNWQRSSKYIGLAEEINSRNAPGASCAPHCREATL